MNHIFGIDASRAVRRAKTGTEWYSYYLIEALSKIDREDQFKLYTPTEPESSISLPDNFRWKILSGKKLWTHTTLRKEIKNDPPDLLFVPSHVLPYKINVPAVVTVHDLAYHYFPKAYSFTDRTYLNIATRNSVTNSTIVIVPSQQTKNDLIKFYRTPELKIRVVPHGVDVRFWSNSSLEKPPINNPYFLTIGRLEERKNTIVAIQAFAQIATKYPRIKLFLSGKNGYGSELISQTIAKLPESIRKRIHLLGHIERSTLKYYLCHAVAFLYPSLYEGFGMPILEAFAAQTPVISSNSSCIPEVAGNGAVLIDPKATSDWSRQMEVLLTNKAKRQKLIASGLEQVKKFSWDRCARETLKILYEAIDG